MTTTTSVEVGRRVATPAAVERMTRGQCARAQQCRAIEQSGIHFSPSYCEDVTRSVRADMAGCATIDSWRLDACFEAIRLQSCQRVAMSERPPADCRKSALCP